MARSNPRGSRRARAATSAGRTGTVCGDGHLDAGEDCDDGNNVNGDGCNNTSNDGCSADCELKGEATCRTPGWSVLGTRDATNGCWSTMPSAFRPAGSCRKLGQVPRRQ